MRQRFRAWLARQDRVSRVAIVTAALVVIGFAGARGWSLLGTDRRLDAARAALHRGEIPAARKILDDCLRDRPESGEVTYLAARAARRDGDYRRASELLARCADLGWPEDATEFEKTLLRAERGEFRAFEPVLYSYVMTEPTPADADLVLEVLIPRYLAEFETRRALDLLDAWAARRPDDLRIRMWQCKAANWLKDFEGAAAALRAAVAIRPDDAELREKLADQLLIIRRADEAKPHFEWLLTRDPDRRTYRLGLARCERELGNLDASAKLLDALLAAEPANPSYLAHRGYCDLFGGRPQQALPRLLAAAERNPHEFDLLTNLALCYEQCGNPEEAKRYRDRAAVVEADLTEMKKVARQLSARPRDPDLLSQAGGILARNGQETEARHWFEMALRVDPTHAPSLKALADLDARMMSGRKK
jgi:tetratricopeptide (TPR) repeat protein